MYGLVHNKLLNEVISGINFPSRKSPGKSPPAKLSISNYYFNNFFPVFLGRNVMNIYRMEIQIAMWNSHFKINKFSSEKRWVGGGVENFFFFASFAMEMKINFDAIFVLLFAFLLNCEMSETFFLLLSLETRHIHWCRSVSFAWKSANLPPQHRETRDGTKSAKAALRFLFILSFDNLTFFYVA